MERTVKLRVKVNYSTYSALKEFEEEYREVLEDAINYGLSTKLPPSLGLKREFTRLRGRSTSYPHTTFTLLVKKQARG
jgi:hypothetical protein